MDESDKTEFERRLESDLTNMLGGSLGEPQFERRNASLAFDGYPALYERCKGDVRVMQSRRFENDRANIVLDTVYDRAINPELNDRFKKGDIVAALKAGALLQVVSVYLKRFVGHGPILELYMDSGNWCVDSREPYVDRAYDPEKMSFDVVNAARNELLRLPPQNLGLPEID